MPQLLCEFLCNSERNNSTTAVYQTDQLSKAIEFNYYQQSSVA